MFDIGELFGGLPSYLAAIGGRIEPEGQQFPDLAQGESDGFRAFDETQLAEVVIAIDAVAGDPARRRWNQTTAFIISYCRRIYAGASGQLGDRHLSFESVIFIDRFNISPEPRFKVKRFLE